VAPKNGNAADRQVLLTVIHLSAASQLAHCNNFLAELSKTLCCWTGTWLWARATTNHSEHWSMVGRRTIIAIVDDDPRARNALQTMLTSLGYRTEVYSSAEHFVRAARDFIASEESRNLHGLLN
jgi:hypothetical protein